MNRWLSCVCIALVLCGCVGAVAVTGDASRQTFATVATSPGMNNIQEVEVLIVVDKRIIQVGDPGDDSLPSNDMTVSQKHQLDSQQHKKLQPLQTELTIANTESIFVESLRRDLSHVGIKVAGVMIHSSSGSEQDRQTLAGSLGSEPRTSALLIVVPTIALSADYRSLLLSATVWLSPHDSNDALMVMTTYVNSTPLNGPDPVAQWSFSGGTRFLHELNTNGSTISQYIATAFHDPSKLQNSGYPYNPAHVFAEENVLINLELALASTGQGARIDFRGSCDDTSNIGKLLFPALKVHTPVKTGGGFESVRDMFRDDLNVVVSEDGSGLIKINIGKVSAAILNTPLPVITFSELEQYNPGGPGGAIARITETSEFKAAMTRLKLEQQSVFYILPVWPSEESYPHLPPSFKNTTVNQILDSIAKIFPAAVWYGECITPKGENFFDIQMSKFSSSDSN